MANREQNLVDGNDSVECIDGAWHSNMTSTIVLQVHSDL